MAKPQVPAKKVRTRSIDLKLDEGEPLVGKRTPIADSHDRYANIEVSKQLAPTKPK